MSPRVPDRPSRPAHSSTDRKLEVLLVSQPVDGGVSKCVMQLAAGAVAAGHKVVVASPSVSGDPFFEAVIECGASHQALLGHNRGLGPGDVSHLVHLRRLMKASDVTHLHSSKAGALGRLAGLTLGSTRPRIIFTPHAWSWLRGGRSERIYELVERLLGRACDVIIAVSPSEADEGRAVIGRSAAPIVVIENGVDRQHFSPQGTLADRDESAPLIVCVGRLARQKGQDVALRALAGMQATDARLRLVGDGPWHDELLALAVRLGVHDRVEFVGAQDNVAAHLRAADVVVSPSRWEGLSLVFLEAMACGKALVVSAVQGSEAVGDAGVVVAVDDAEGLATVLDGLLADPERRAALGARARERSARFDVSNTVAANLQLWEQ